MTERLNSTELNTEWKLGKKLSLQKLLCDLLKFQEHSEEGLSFFIPHWSLQLSNLLRSGIGILDMSSQRMVFTT